MTRLLLLLIFPLCLLGQTRAVINTGSSANDGTGDSLRTFALKSNTNFAALWDQVFTNGSSGSSYSFSTNAFTTSGTNVSLSATIYSPLTISGSFAVTSSPSARISGTNVWLEGSSSVRIYTPALYGGTATDGQVLTLTDDVNGTVEFAAPSDSTKLPLAGGTMSGALNMGSQRITATAAPSASTDAANWQSVTNQTFSGISSQQHVVTPALLATNGVVVTDPTGANPPVWLDYSSLATLVSSWSPTNLGSALKVWYDASLESASTTNAADSFTRTDSAVTIGPNWVVVAGTWGISGNKAYSVTSGATKTVVTNAVSYIGDMTCEVNTGDNRGCGLIFNWIDANNYMQASLKATTIEVAKIVAGAGTLLGNYSSTHALNTAYTVRINRTATQVLTYVNGTLVGTYALTGAEQTLFNASSQFGLRIADSGSGGLNVRFDDFQVVGPGTLGTLTDRSGNGNHATQATEAQKPVVAASGRNGLNILGFTRASSQWMSSSSFTSLPQPNTIFVVGQFAATTAQDECLFDGGSARNALLKASVDAVGTLRSYHGTSFNWGLSDTSWHVYEVVSSGDSSEIIVDGGPRAIGRGGSLGLNQMTIGAIQGGASGYLGGNLAEVIVLDTATETERNRVRQYLARKWAIPTVSYTKAGIESGTFRYSSSIDAPVNLFANYAYPMGSANLPIVVHMHGFSGDVTGLHCRNIIRQAGYGAFVIALGLRGRDGATGSQDASGREISDIYDAIRYVSTNAVFGRMVNSNLVSVVGYSGGGGNAMAFASKYPDTAAQIVSHFGISDYGQNSAWGWYQNGADGSQQTLMQSWIGGTPGAAADAYAARNHSRSIGTNYSGGWVYLFHDEGDLTVRINQSLAVVTNMVAAGNIRYTTNWTSAASGTRWTHGIPNDGAGVVSTEPIWLSALAGGTHQPWIVPTSGTVVVSGYIVTKRFSIWLGTGTSEVATVTYNTDTATYIVTPATGSTDVTITQGSRTATLTGISSATTTTLP